MGAYMKSRFVIRLYWFGLASSIAVLVVVALRTGLFGSSAKDLASPVIDPAFAFYELNKDLVDKAVVAILSIGTAITGGLGLLKSYYYADSNLPGRLQEMIEDARDRHAHDRRELLAYVSGPFETADLLTPGLLANPIAACLKLVGYASLRTRARDAATDVPRLSAELKAIAIAKEHAENALATGHIIRGTCLTREGDELTQDAVAREKKYKAAVKEFEGAIALRPEDLDALEGAATAAGRLAMQVERLQFLEKAIVVAEASGAVVRGSRLTRGASSILHASINPDDQRAARARLDAAADTLNDAEPDQRYELAEVLLQMGEIQASRGRKPTAKRHLKRVIALGNTAQQEQASAIARQHEVDLS